MQAYDDWKLMMRYGNDVYFIGKVDDGDPDYVAFWDRKNNLPDETVFNSVSEGVDLMLNNLIVIHLQEGTIRGFVKDNSEKRIDRGLTQYFQRENKTEKKIRMERKKPQNPN